MNWKPQKEDPEDSEAQVLNKTMKVIVPMAGMGKRLRPHTLTTPKPLIPVAGKSIVERLVEDIAAITGEQLEEVAYVTGRFGEEVEKDLIAVAERLGAKGRICYQDQAMGTAHAILCAAESLEGHVTVAFADTLFKADFKPDPTVDGVLWVQRIPNPEQFGVVKLDEQGNITDFVEKPKTFVSDLAMIGIYSFKDGAALRKELEYLIDNNIMNSGEYQLPDALRNMMKKGMKFAVGLVEDWMDCGNKDATVDTNQKVLEYNKHLPMIDKTAILQNSTVLHPCYIGAGVEIHNSVVGPHVSIGGGTKVSSSIIKNSIIQNDCELINMQIKDSMIGRSVKAQNMNGNFSLGDYSEIK